MKNEALAKSKGPSRTQVSQGIGRITFHLLHLLDPDIIHGWVKDVHLTPRSPDDILLKRYLAIAAKRIHQAGISPQQGCPTNILCCK
jgi:hypothetical protein